MVSTQESTSRNQAQLVTPQTAIDMLKAIWNAPALSSSKDFQEKHLDEEVLKVHTNPDGSLVELHHTTNVSQGAHISDNVTIGRYCNIGPDVHIESHVKIGSGVKIIGPAIIESRSEIEDDVYIGNNVIVLGKSRVVDSINVTYDHMIVAPDASTIVVVPTVSPD